MWPQFRKTWWFWGTLVPLLAIQVAILSHFAVIRVFVEQFNPIIWFLLIILNFLCVATALVLVASGFGSKER
jgi:hypothetical protein